MGGGLNQNFQNYRINRMGKSSYSINSTAILAHYFHNLLINIIFTIKTSRKAMLTL